MERAYALVSLFSFGAAIAGTSIIRHLAPRLGLLDRPSDRKIHKHPTALGGGVAIWAAVTATVLAGLFYVTMIMPHIADLPWVPGLLTAHLEGILSKSSDVAVILVGATALAAIGLADDLLGLRARWKLIIQVVVAVAVVACGIRASVYISASPVSFVLSVFWIVGITNAFNLLDNMDGLAAGVAFIAAGVLFVVAIQTDQVFVASLLATLMGALLGFLLFNFPPASIFMGDSGSLFVGFMLASTAIVFTYVGEQPKASESLLPIAVPLLVFAVPIYDTCSVVFIRLKERRSIFQADKCHLSHRMVDFGMTKGQAVLFIYLLTFALAVTSTTLFLLTRSGSLIMLIQTAAIVTAMVMLEATGSRRS